MTDDSQFLMLEHLKALRKEGAETLADLKSRASSQEEISGQILILLGALGKRFDRSEERFARIERRMDLVEA